MGFARLAEQGIRRLRGVGEKDKLGALDKIAASTVGGALGTWNQPIEVVRVEMQSMAKQTSANRPAKLTVFNTLAYVYKEGGIKALYRGVTPRIGLGIWQTVGFSLTKFFCTVLIFQPTPFRYAWCLLQTMSEHG
jgi:shikimate kinase